MNAKALAAEFVGTFALIFIGVGVIVADSNTGLTGIALAHGLTIAVMASALGAVSGGHFNPAVSLGLFAGKVIDAGTMAGYWIAQLAGAAVAAFAANFLFDSAAAAHGMPATPETVTMVRAIGLEAIATFFLVTTVYGTAVDKRGPKLGALLIGLSITAGILAIGPLTGAALNPARWFGPALASGNMSQAAIYLAGPLLGGLMAGLLYSNLFSDHASKSDAPA